MHPEENFDLKSVMDLTLQELLKGGFNMFPLGGQHYCEATALAGARYPSHADFRRIRAFIFMPMPKHLSDQVIYHTTIIY